MSFYESIKTFIKEHASRSSQLIKTKSLKEVRDGHPVTIKHKVQVKASDLTNDQVVIDQVVNKIISKDYSKRSYAGKTDKDLAAYNKKIYRYESYRTKNVKLVPSPSDRLDIYIENTYLGRLPQKDTKQALEHLQSSIFMAFAYVDGGPYRQCPAEIQNAETEKDPYDLHIYIQFS
ncbi:hypothetical protein ADIAL_0039 [Alkalibacterium sp. AK22]|uniref:hypothetical protein n=1 Tax=Alkalibacterium sp. AK22 TaxID=1229520 RepID=UPI000450C8E4|nr:hypothetical protein [Alkalibacterium sp. AK22]EXJ24473.1 hypothetical protein ADIAL_0039 [Alkalibacterium sp. AK22]